MELEIDFISDVACPWCAIGLAGLDEALRRTAGQITAQVRFQPFELNPGMRPEGENIDEYIGGHYGADPERMTAMRAAVRERAAGVGIAFNQDSTSRIYNTFDAHRLLFWARGSGRQHALKQALFRANFTAGANVSDPGVLVAAAVESGLDGAEARQILASGRFGEEVREAERHWQAQGIRGVPAVVINGRWLISGGQPPEQFEQALRQIAAQS